MADDSSKFPEPQDDPYALAPQEKKAAPLSAVQKAEQELRQKGVVPAKPKVDLPGRSVETEGAVKGGGLEAPPAVKWICTICNFEMLGKPRKGTCPECGAPVNPRATGLLQYATPSWISYVGMGCLILFGGVTLHVLAIVVNRAWDYPRMSAAMQMVAALLEIAGVWVVTTQENHPQATVSTFALPARLAGILSFIVYVIMAAMIWKNVDPDHPPMKIIALALFTSSAVAFCVGFHLRSLAIRMPSDSLSSHTQNLSWIVALACVFLGAMTLSGFVSVFDDQTLGRMFMISFPIVGALIVISIWAAWILVRMYLNMRDCAIAAATPPRKKVAVKPGAAKPIEEVLGEQSTLREK